MNKLLAALLVAACATPASATKFNFSETIGTDYAYQHNLVAGPFEVSGTFDGDASGNIISNISNITLVINGQQITGPIYGAHYIHNVGYQSGGATISFDGTAIISFSSIVITQIMAIIPDISRRSLRKILSLRTTILSGTMARI